MKHPGQAIRTTNNSTTSPRDEEESSIRSAPQGRFHALQGSPTATKPCGRGAILLSRSTSSPANNRRSQGLSYGPLGASVDDAPRSPSSSRRAFSDPRYESCEEAVNNASALAFQRSYLESPHLDPRHTSGSKAYKPDYGRLSPPPREEEEAYESNGSGGVTLAERDRDEELPRALEELSLEQSVKEKIPESEEVAAPATGDKPSLQLDVKLDNDSSQKKIRVTANLSVSTSFSLNKELWGGKKYQQALKEVVRKRMQLQMKEILEKLSPKEEVDSEDWKI